FLRLTGQVKNKKMAEILKQLQIEHLAQQQMHSISGGETQRVLLARALLRNPDLLILDEPAQGVDLAGQAELYKLISNLRHQFDCGVLMISHDLHLVMSATDEVVCLNHHICCHGKPDQVSNDPAYLDLFGAKAAQNLAVYTHHHNHEHDIAGAVKSEDD
ncbi:MAG: ATP-binding cassette domain-containing protein, partial [Gammaproteobacteria bacterium]